MKNRKAKANVHMVSEPTPKQDPTTAGANSELINRAMDLFEENGGLAAAVRPKDESK
jgi:hypothetical protein